ncbi:histidine kinase/DNA gyrase B/HSP90-like ATPase [Bradyrhizobium sp. R2.2-H]|nr:histidine kinase/DNA gyrase B/HSP90-like ATPase [Bradyrhizobium sp. Y-H1]TCU65915.1 histidine kinase/DNA gyrase B/HSP90-like ATPase [Bradyrhizobium sp. R2.2-H]
MPISVLGESAETVKTEPLTLLEMRSHEDRAKALVETALQWVRASAGAVVSNEDSQFVPFATSDWAANAVGADRLSSSYFTLGIRDVEHAGGMQDPISMSEVLSMFAGANIELSVVWIPLTFGATTVELIYLEGHRGGSFGAVSVESFSAAGIQVAAVLDNLRSTDDPALKRDLGIARGLELLGEQVRAHLSFTRMDGIILEVLGMFRDELETSCISVRADIDEGLPELRGCRLQLQQVVFNLVRNGIDAIKDVHGGGRRLEISCRADDLEMLVTFRDRGSGLEASKNDLDRSIDPFFTPKSSGMSFSSFISRCIIEAHRGRIWAERNEESGLTIRLALPL